MPHNGITLVFLTKGKVAIVDEQDAPAILAHKWCYSKGYAVRAVGGRKNYSMVNMHKIILPCSDGQEVDHKNRNRLDNRRSNLRCATHSQNLSNGPLRRNNKSGFIGVNWHKGARKWMAQITVNGKGVHLGLFEDAREAAKAYDLAAEIHFGEFARRNIHEDLQPHDHAGRYQRRGK